MGDCIVHRPNESTSGRERCYYCGTTDVNVHVLGKPGHKVALDQSFSTLVVPWNHLGSSKNTDAWPHLPEHLTHLTQRGVPGHRELQNSRSAAPLEDHGPEIRKAKPMVGTTRASYHYCPNHLVIITGENGRANAEPRDDCGNHYYDK